MLDQVDARTAERDVAAMTYTEFIQIGQLLDLQYQIPGAPDSLFFVIAHQVTELWFRVIVHELDLTRTAMDADDLREARYRLNRVVRGEDVLVAHLRAVETISPGNFALIRQHLGTSSAFESVQFREIEFLSGRKDRRYLESSRLTDVERVRLRARFTEPSLVDALTSLLDRRGQPDLREVMAGRADPDLCALIDALLEHDLGVARWRAGHAQMAERIIGYRTGTGGSTGVEYLQGTTGNRFFPHLWEIRSAL